MKRFSKIQIKNLAETIYNSWVCRYGRRNADKLSLAVRRKFRRLVLEIVKQGKEQELRQEKQEGGG